MEAIDIIKEHLSSNGITQSKLAELSGLSFGCINRILNGKAKLMPNTLAKIADALEISIADIEDRRCIVNRLPDQNGSLISIKACLVGNKGVPRF